MEVRNSGKACILAKWENDRKYDADGSLVRRDDQSRIWPLYDISTLKDERGIEKDGRILLLFKFHTEAEPAE
jgi:hypothetical protein